MNVKPNDGYIAFHQPRFAFLVEILRQNIRTPSARILDIGRSHLTSLMAEELKLPVDSLGLEPDEQLPGGYHYSFDLNEIQFPERWRQNLGPFDVVVFAEVLEHLYTAPELVLRFLQQLLVPGGLLLVQTPNAASLRKRVKLALGQNPFERIRTDRSNPGHFREYTSGELTEILRNAGFSVDRLWIKHYCDARFARHHHGDELPQRITGSIKNVVYRILPPSLREGITILARNR